MTHKEAIAMFKEVKQGELVVTIGRRTVVVNGTLSSASSKKNVVPPMKSIKSLSPESSANSPTTASALRQSSTSVFSIKEVCGQRH